MLVHTSKRLLVLNWRHYSGFGVYKGTVRGLEWTYTLVSAKSCRPVLSRELRDFVLWPVCRVRACVCVSACARARVRVEDEVDLDRICTVCDADG